MARDITDQGWVLLPRSPPDGSEFPVYEPGICRPPNPYGRTLPHIARSLRGLVGSAATVVAAVLSAVSAGGQRTFVPWPGWQRCSLGGQQGAITRPGTTVRPDCALAALRGEETPDGIACRPELPCAVAPPERNAALGHVVAARPAARSSSPIGVGWSGYTRWSLCPAVLGRSRRAEPARVIREREEYANEGGEVLT